MQLNSFAGRTYNDLDQVYISNLSAVISRLFSIFCHCCVAFAWQYFVLPWVLRDYTSLRLDLTDQACYRDLSRPVGAQTEARRQLFRERYACWPDPEVGYHDSTIVCYSCTYSKRQNFVFFGPLLKREL